MQRENNYKEKIWHFLVTIRNIKSSLREGLNFWIKVVLHVSLHQTCSQILIFVEKEPLNGINVINFNLTFE